MLRSGVTAQRMGSVSSVSSLDDVRDAVEASRQAGMVRAAAAPNPLDGKPRRRERFSSSGADSTDRGGWVRGLDEVEEAAMGRLPLPMSPTREAPAIPAELLMPEIGRKAQVVLDTTPTMHYVKLSLEHKTDRLNYIKLDQMERIRFQNVLQPTTALERRKSQAGATAGPGPGSSALAAGAQLGQTVRASMPALPEGRPMLQREASLPAPTAPKTRVSMSGGFVGGRVAAGGDRRARSRASSSDGSSSNWNDPDIMVGGSALTARPSQLRLPTLELSTGSIASHVCAPGLMTSPTARAPRRISFAGGV